VFGVGHHRGFDQLRLQFVAARPEFVELPTYLGIITSPNDSELNVEFRHAADHGSPFLYEPIERGAFLAAGADRIVTARLGLGRRLDRAIASGKGSAQGGQHR
jgi:hypothetical protein